MTSAGSPTTSRRLRWNWQTFLCVCVLLGGIKNTFLCFVFLFCPPGLFSTLLCALGLYQLSSCFLRFWLALASGTSAGGLEEPHPSCRIGVARAVLCFVSRSQLLFSGPLCQPATVTDLSGFLVTLYLSPLGVEVLMAP